jgi:hypothetical protein
VVVCDCGNDALATLSKFSDFADLVLQTTILILTLRFQEWSPPVVACDCGKGVLATLSKFSDFVLVLQATTTLILTLRFQEMVTPRCGM